MDDNRLRILIESVLDERGFKKSEDALKKLEKQAEEVGEATKKSGGGMTSFMDASLGFLRTVGTVTGVVGAAMAPIAKSAQEYVNTVKLANATSREWLATTYQIEQAQLKIGEANAKAFGPIYSWYGDKMEQLGNLAKENPQTTNVVTGLGGLAGLGLGWKMLSAIGAKLGIGGGAAGGTATGAGTGLSVASGVTIGGIVTSVLAGLGLGLGVTDMISKTPWGERNEVQPFGKNVTVMANEFGKFFDLLDELIGNDPVTGDIGSRIAMVVGQQFGVLPIPEGGNVDKNGKPVEKTLFEEVMEWFKGWGKELESITTGASTSGVVKPNSYLGPMLANNPSGKSDYLPEDFLKMQMDFRQQEYYSQEDHNRQLTYMQDDFLRNRNYQEMDFNRQTGIQERNFNIQQMQSEKMFYLQRAIALRDFQISVSRNDYDYALSRKRAQEDQNFSLKQIMLSGDALAYYYSQRQFNINKQRAEEDYQLQKQRSQEDFNRSQADSQYMFNIQRAFTKQQFDISMADRENEYKITRQRAEWEFNNVTLKRNDEEYKIMANRRLEAFYENILPLFLEENERRLVYEGMYRDISIQGYVDAATAMQTYFNNIVIAYTRAGYGSSPRSESRDSGGYVNYGMYQLHDHEYVLNKSTTKSLESVAQGRLTQEKVLGLLSGGGNGMTYNDNRQFTRGLSIDEKIMLKQELRQLVVEAFR